MRSSSILGCQSGLGCVSSLRSNRLTSYVPDGGYTGGDPEPGPGPEPEVYTDKALGMPAFASGYEAPMVPSQAVDGSIDTRWASDWVEHPWISIDLKKIYNSIGRITLVWEAAYAKSYTISVSEDGETWTDVVHESNLRLQKFPTTAEHTFPDVRGRYVKLVCDEKAMEAYGISLWDFQIMASDEGEKSPNSYKYVLAVMPEALRSALVAWYDPHLQNLTNDDLMDRYPTWMTGLKDLSGNGRNGNIYNMDGEVGGYVDEQGYLEMDGADDYIGLYLPYTGGWSFMYDAAWTPQSGTKFLIASHMIVGGAAKYIFRIAPKSANDGCIYVDYDNVDTYADMHIASTEAWNNDTVIVGKLRNTGGYNASQTFRRYVHFSRRLTADEQQWVKDNMFIRTVDTNLFDVDYFFANLVRSTQGARTNDHCLIQLTPGQTYKISSNIPYSDTFAMCFVSNTDEYVSPTTGRNGIGIDQNGDPVVKQLEASATGRLMILIRNSYGSRVTDLDKIRSGEHWIRIEPVN